MGACCTPHNGICMLAAWLWGRTEILRQHASAQWRFWFLPVVSHLDLAKGWLMEAVDYCG